MPRNTDLTNLPLLGTKHLGEMRTFKIKDNHHGIGVQFLDLRSRMTGSEGGEPYRFLTDRSESKYANEGFRVKRRIYFLFFLG